jgi:2-methylisocitrate lyase-like PEP mutase family enzyme
VGETVRLAVATGLAGCSIEDSTGRPDEPIYSFDLAVERVAAASDASQGEFVLTARSENYLHGRPDLAATVARLQAFGEAGADVLYAPGLTSLDEIATLVREVAPKPVNVLARPGAPSVGELASVGVARVSVGGAFAFAAAGAVVAAARELLEEGTYGFWDTAKVGAKAAHDAFGG